MEFRVTFAATNHNPDTIWNRLARKLGREPTNAECREEVFRILDKSDVATAKQVKNKKKRMAQ